MSGSSKEARWAAHEALVHDGNFEEVLCKSTGLNVVVVSFADTAQEAHRAWEAKLKLEHAQHVALSLQDLVLRVAVVDHVDDLADRGTVDLLILGSNEDGSSTNKLQLAERDHLAREESVNVVDAEIQGLRKKSKAQVDLDEPVHEDRAHRPLNLSLVVHVVRVWHQAALWHVSKTLQLLVL